MRKKKFYGIKVALGWKIYLKQFIQGKVNIFVFALWKLATLDQYFLSGFRANVFINSLSYCICIKRISIHCKLGRAPGGFP